MKTEFLIIDATSFSGKAILDILRNTWEIIARDCHLLKNIKLMKQTSNKLKEKNKIRSNVGNHLKLKWMKY